MWGRFGEHRFTFLLAALLLLLLLAPIAPVLASMEYASLGAALVGVLFILVLLAAVPAVGGTRKTVGIAAALAAPSVVLRGIDLFVHNDALRPAHQICGTIYLVFVAALILKHLFRVQRVTFNAISAALCVYMVLGVLWCLAYSLLDVLDTGAFSMSSQQSGDTGPTPPGPERTITLLYYSFTTLTTLGYGDIAPASHFARMLAVTEAVVGQIILVVLVARLVGMHVAQWTDPRQDSAK
jgi:hypothetical protein